MRSFEQALGPLGEVPVAPPPAAAEAAVVLPGRFARLLRTTIVALRARLVPVPKLFRRLVRRRQGEQRRRERRRQAFAGLRLATVTRSVPRPRYLARLREPAGAPAWIRAASRPALARLRRLALDAGRRRSELAAERIAIAFAQAERELAGEPHDPNARRLFLDLRHAAERAELATSLAGVRRLGLEIALKELDLVVAEGDAAGGALSALRASLRDLLSRARLATGDEAIQAIVAEAAGALQKVDRLVRPTSVGAIGGVGPRAARLRARIMALQPRLDAAPEGAARTRVRLALAWRRHALRHLA